MTLAFNASALTLKNPFGPLESDIVIEQWVYVKVILLFGFLSAPTKTTITSFDIFPLTTFWHVSYREGILQGLQQYQLYWERPSNH